MQSVQTNVKCIKFQRASNSFDNSFFQSLSTQNFEYTSTCRFVSKLQSSLWILMSWQPHRVTSGLLMGNFNLSTYEPSVENWSSMMAPVWPFSTAKFSHSPYTHQKSAQLMSHHCCISMGTWVSVKIHCTATKQTHIAKRKRKNKYKKMSILYITGYIYICLSILLYWKWRMCSIQ